MEIAVHMHKQHPFMIWSIDFYPGQCFNVDNKLVWSDVVSILFVKFSLKFQQLISEHPQINLGQSALNCLKFLCTVIYWVEE